jgi:hypothetical protein
MLRDEEGRSVEDRPHDLRDRESSMSISPVSTNSVLNNAVGGLDKADAQLNQATQNIANGSLDPQDVVSLSLASTNVQANVAVLKTDAQTQKSLLNILT